MPDFIYIDTKEELNELAGKLLEAEELAIDIECENNLHHFGTYISLIQISDGKNNWVVDVLKIKEIRPLIRVLENEKIKKVFHDFSFDFRILNSEFHCRPKNIFDTQLAALLLGKENIGLGDLLEQYLKIKKERKFQKADWAERPLSSDMLSYAAKDTMYLLELKEILKRELREKNRLSWAEEEFKFIEDSEFTYKDPDFMGIKGIKELFPEQLSIFKQLFLLRKRLAVMVDRPVHFVISNKRLKQFVINPPDWKNVRSVHPIVRQSAEMFEEAVREGRRDRIVIHKKKKRKYADEEREIFELLYLLQERLSKKFGIKGHLIINREQMAEVAFNKNIGCLRGWQRKLLEEEGFGFSKLK